MSIVSAGRKVILAGLVVSGLMSAAVPGNAQVRRERDSRFIVSIGEAMPRFDYVALDGDTLDSDFLRGQVVLLQFCASWCPFSQAQLVDMQWGVWRRHRKDANFSLLLINEDLPQDRQHFLDQRQERELTMPLTFDEQETIYRQFVTPNGSVTRTVIVGASGTIVSLYDVHTRMTRYLVKRDVRRELRKLRRQR